MYVVEGGKDIFTDLFPNRPILNRRLPPKGQAVGGRNGARYSQEKSARQK